MLLQNLRLVLHLLGNELRQGRDATTGLKVVPVKWSAPSYEGAARFYE